MNFNIDDPLADLLSDNSLDNDNFFDNPNVSTARKSIRTAKSKSKIEDLFGIKEETEADVQKLQNSAVTISTQSIGEKPLKSQDHDINNDTLGFDPKRPKNGKNKKILNDLLGTMDPKKNIFDEILGNEEIALNKQSTVGKHPMSRQSTDTTTDTSIIQTQQGRSKTSLGRRSSTQSTFANTNQLDLFGREKDREANVNVSAIYNPMPRKRGNTADWLGMSVDSSAAVELVRKEPPDTLHITQQTKVIEELKNDDGIHQASEPDEADIELELPVKLPIMNTDTTAENIILLNSINMDSNNAYTMMQQQESQLVITAQIKNQERILLELQRKQETLLHQHDAKFNALIQQQLKRQTQMEEHIKMQQQRIDNYIQLMMAQPPFVEPVPNVQRGTPKPLCESLLESGLVSANAADVTVHPVCEEKLKQLIQLENDVKRNELEKIRLEELVANMKVNYEQEIHIIESSYKKQLQTVQDHMVAMEDRLKSESVELKQHYTEKIQNHEHEVQKLKNEHQAEISILKQDHEDEIRKLRQSQEADLKLIKDEDHRIIEAIRESKLVEFAATQGNTNYLETLKMASNNLGTLSDGLESLRHELVSKMEINIKERERKLDMRERIIEDNERRLKLSEETADEEKHRLMDLVSTLELQLNRLSKDSAEENWQLRQRMSGLDAERKAFENEKEFYREQIERDEKRIEDLKSLQLAEKERLNLDIQQERSRLIIERTQFEMERRLHGEGDLNKERLQLEAQMKSAKEAIRHADEQRNNYYKEHRDLEYQKRYLVEKQNEIKLKEDELAQASSAYRLAISRTQAAEHKARETEQVMRVKMDKMYKQVEDISEKEAQIAQERMLLAQDRIALHNMKEQIRQSKCTLCKVGTETAYNRSSVMPKDLGPFGSNTDGIKFGFTNSITINQTDVVDRMLDENIDASYRRMYDAHSPLEWTTIGLDDDTKNQAINNHTF